MGSNKVIVDVWSDYSCPWCIVGKTRLERAIGKLDEAQRARVSVVFHPYVLMPRHAKTQPWREFYEPYAGFRELTDHPAYNVGREEDKIPFAGWVFVPTTIQAQRLTHFFCPQERRPALIARIFALNYEEAKDIGDLSVLVAAAKDVGLDAAAVDAYLRSDTDVRKLLEESGQASRGPASRGVPKYIIRGGSIADTPLGGAQPVDVFFDTLRAHLGC